MSASEALNQEAIFRKKGNVCYEDLDGRKELLLCIKQLPHRPMPCHPIQKILHLRFSFPQFLILFLPMMLRSG